MQNLMYRKINISLVRVVCFCGVLLAANASNAKVTTYYFGGAQPSVGTVFVNPYNYTQKFPQNVPVFTLNNLVSPTTEKYQISAIYDLATVTGLSVPDNKQAIVTTNGTPREGNSAIQANGTNFGLYLNLRQVNQFPFKLPNSSTQLAYAYSSPPRIWEKPENTMLCMSSAVDLHTSVLGSNPNLSNQQVFSFLFRDKSSGKQFWWNIMFYDSRPTIIPDDFIMKDNPNDTGLPIVMTFAKSQSGIGSLLRDVPNYGNPLRSFYTGSNKVGMTDVGGCIQKSQFLDAIKTMKVQYPEFAKMSESLETYDMTVINLAIEIAHNYTNDRAMAMSAKGLWVYSLDDPEKNVPDYGFFYSGAQNINYACNVTPTQSFLKGWVDVGNGCYHKGVEQLNNFQNQVAQCTSKTSFCNSNNKIENTVCGCKQGLSVPWVFNQEKNSDGTHYRTCYRYETDLACIY